MYYACMIKANIKLTNGKELTLPVQFFGWPNAGYLILNIEGASCSICADGKIRKVTGTDKRGQCLIMSDEIVGESLTELNELLPGLEKYIDNL